MANNYSLVAMIYLDHAAATPLDPRVAKEIRETEKFFGNPSSPHKEGERAFSVLEDCRKRLASIMKVKPGEVIFTSSGTESVNLAILGMAKANKAKGGHIIVSAVEHLSVLNCAKELERWGYKITYIKPDNKGIINPQDVAKAVTVKTILLSIGLANNEIGTIQPLREIINLIRNKRSGDLPYIHTDAAQGADTLNIRPHDLKVDALSLNGEKIYGPKGVGCLFVRRGIKIEPIMYGGNQERGLRPGTENISAIAGFAKAFELADAGREKESKKQSELRDYCIKKILSEIKDSKLNGHPAKRLVGNVNVSFKDVDGERLMMELSDKNIFISTGSACTTGETEQSHVLKAIGAPKEWGNIRVTLGRGTTKKEIDTFLNTLKNTVAKLTRLI